MLTVEKTASYVDLAKASALLPFRTGPDEGVLAIRLLAQLRLDKRLRHFSSEEMAEHLGVNLRLCSRVINLMLKHGVIEHKPSEWESGLHRGPTFRGNMPRKEWSLSLTNRGHILFNKIRNRNGLSWRPGRCERLQGGEL